MTATLTEQLRKVAAHLRKRGALQTTPKPIGNPVASRTTGDLGSLDEIGKASGVPKPGTGPSLPKLAGG